MVCQKKRQFVDTMTVVFISYKCLRQILLLKNYSFSASNLVKPFYHFLCSCYSATLATKTTSWILDLYLHLLGTCLEFQRANLRATCVDKSVKLGQHCSHSLYCKIRFKTLLLWDKSNCLYFKHKKEKTKRGFPCLLTTDS